MQPSSLPCDPIRLIPRQQPTVWGGSLLHDLLRKPASVEPVGESWEVWEGDRVADGPLAGKTLGDLSRSFPDALLGPEGQRVGNGRFPLLTKFIDAQQPLSVQVHPNDLQAGELEGQPNGKTEAWHILAAAEGAWVIHGLEKVVDPTTLRARLQAGTADPLLRKVVVRPGDTVFVPAGTIHAIGPGVLLHEVQQTSDVTYRLYDWNRQAQGSKRELHLDKGLRVSRCERSRSPVVLPLEWEQLSIRWQLILATPYFIAKRAELQRAVEVETLGRSFHVLTVLEGRGFVETGGAGRLQLAAGDSVVLPACLQRYRLSPDGELTVLIEHESDITQELVPELRTLGLPQSRIDDFLAQFS